MAVRAFTGRSRHAYLIDFYGTGNPTTTLYTWEGADITQVESWDMTSSPTAYNHFVTAEYLEEGFHYFVFTVDTAHLYFHEVTIEAFQMITAGVVGTAAWQLFGQDHQEKRDAEFAEMMYYGVQTACGDGTVGSVQITDVSL